MIIDTTDCLIIRESEWGVYDTARVTVTYACGNYVRLADGTASYSDDGKKYTVLVTDNNGNLRSDSATLTVTAIAPVVTTHPASVRRPIGSTASFSVTAYGTGTLSYQWQKNSGDITDATVSSYTTPSITTADSNTTYRCIISNATGSATSNAATLTIGADNAMRGFGFRGAWRNQTRPWKPAWR